MNYAHSLVALLVLLMYQVGVTWAQSDGADSARPQEPTTIELIVSPAAEARPALKYTLLPTPGERTPGNAAQHYYRAIVLQKQQPKELWQEFNDKHQAWLAASIDDAQAKAEIARWLASQKNALAEVRAGAFREYCDWDFRLQDLRGPELLSFLLPEIQECRTLARTIQLQARLAIMEGRPDDALEALRTGFQLARDAAQPPYLISGLVGVAITNVMTDELVRLIQHTDANYYWALAALPEPLVDLRPAMQFEMHMPAQMFPFLQDAETADRSPDEWRKLILGCVRGLESLGGSSSAMNDWQSELAATGLVAKMYPQAKQQLIDEGFDRDRVEAMPVGQVVAIQTSRSVQYAFHEVFKLSHLPYQEATGRMPQTLKRLEAEGHLHGKFSGREGLPLTSLLLPAVSGVMQAETRNARNLATVQAIEAIRMHAAASGGKLPKSLAEITIVPVPANPATGQPFPYTLDAAANQATLEVAPIGSLTPQQDGKRYVIKLKGQ
jgi:hypothetical protein